MSLTFGNYKQVIPPQILTRGRDYLHRGQVLDLTFDEEEVLWEAQVEGTELYDVQIRQDTNGNLICSCTCPYDLGEHCKHVAAVLYAIEETFPEQMIVRPRKRGAKRLTQHDKLRQLLEKTTHEQLITVLIDLAGQDRELLNQLMIRLDTDNSKPMDYRRVVKDMLRTGRGDYGFLDYSGSNRAGQKVEQLLYQAQQWVETGNVEKSVRVYQAVIDEVVPAIAHADDSNGTLGGCISFAVEGLNNSVELLDESGREALFAFCLERVRRREFRSWDWGWDLLSTASDMVHDPRHRALFESTLKDIEGDIQDAERSDLSNRYHLEKIALFRLNLIERFEDNTAARKFLRSKSHLDKLRMILIERSINEGNLAEALELIRAGITSSEERRLPGLRDQYQALWVNLLQAQGDKPAMVDAARKLWLDSGDKDTFALLERTVPNSEWAAFVDSLIEDNQRNSERLAWLLAHENRWNDLLKLIQSDWRSRWLLESYRDQMESHFPVELTNLYEQEVDRILANASGRNHYQQAVLYLRRIQKIDRTGRVEEIVSRLRSQYARRPALLDELSQL